MGKKSKKLKYDSQNTTTSEHLPEIINVKKKRKHKVDHNPDNNFVASDDDVNTACEQILKAEEHEPQNSIEVKKKHKKKLNLIDNEIPDEKTKVSNVDNDPIVPKKKKKKAKLLEVEGIRQKIDGTVDDETGEQKQKVHKQKKINGNVINGDEKIDEKSDDKVVDEAKGQKKKSKRKTGNAVLNEEESQVTEEDIDRFCDELDVEDNKQYEDWVKLIEASLPPPRPKN